MLACKCKSELSAQMKYVFRAKCYFVSFLARNQWVNFPLEIYDTRKDLYFYYL